MIKNTTIFIALLVGFGCEMEKKDHLLGHWHAINQSSFFKTMDINDTLTITDEYLLDGGDRIECPRKNRLGKPILPLEYKYLDTFTLLNDTLTIWDSTSSYKYVRSNLEDCILSDRYANSKVDLSLNLVPVAENYDISYKTYCTENLFIGRLRKGSTYFDSISVVYPDSIFIQARDVFINFDDIPLLCQHLKSMCIGYKPTNINFHSDTHVSKQFLKKIQDNIPDTITIHQTVRMTNGDIGLQEIQ